MDLKGSSHGLACSSRSSCSGCGLCFSVNWQAFNPSYFCFNVPLKSGDTCRVEVSNSQEHIPVPELGLRVSVPCPPSVPLTALAAQGGSPEFTPCSRTASSLSHQLQADQKTHFSRDCWEWEPAQLFKHCSLRCVNCFHAEKTNHKPGTMMQPKVQDSCLLMPLNRMHCPTINFD